MDKVGRQAGRAGNQADKLYLGDIDRRVEDKAARQT